MEYVIKLTKDESLEDVARLHHTTVERLRMDNNTDFVSEGMRLLIRKNEKEYVVRPYDTLELIAKSNNTTVKKIKEINGIEGIFLGQIILLP